MKPLTKVAMFENELLVKLEEDINLFTKNIKKEYPDCEIVDIKFFVEEGTKYAMVIYHKCEE